LRAGASIEATADGDSAPWTLSDVRLLGSETLTGAQDSDDSAVPQLLRDVHHVVVGEYAPTPELRDQAGKPFSLRDLRGQTVVMAFIYTRCRDARECPYITARFRSLQQKLRYSPAHLVEVTLDPAYDRPAVLANYGRAFGQDPSRWTFVTGDPETVLNFAAQFDVTAFADERVGLIHPERTVVLDRYGAIRELIDEGAWSPDEIVATVRHDERLASNPFERLDLWLSSAAVSVCGNAVAGFSGFTDLLTVLGIGAFFAFLLWRVGRSIAKGAA
jgi:protein SCO1/2